MLVTITVALAAVAVLAAIVVVAVGGGGELSTEHPDHPPLALPGRRAVGGTDAALLRLPLGLWGYHKQITDEALERFAYELTERDTRIAVLEQQLAEVRQGTGGDSWGRHRALPPSRNDMPVMGDAPLATRTDRDSAPLGLPAAEDPFVTRTDGIPTREKRAEAHPAPPTDPWKTVVDDEPEAKNDARAEAKTEVENDATDGAEDETENEAEDEAKNEAEAGTNAEAGTKAEEEAGDAGESGAVRKDDGE